MYVKNGWLSLDPIYLSLLHPHESSNSRTISRTWMDFKMADTSERRVFCNTILLKFHGSEALLFKHFAELREVKTPHVRIM